MISGALSLSACGADKPAIPPVAPVVQPMPQEGLFGEEAASDTSDEESLDTSSKADESKASDKTKAPEKAESKPASSSGESESPSADKASEPSSGKAEKPKQSHTKYKHKAP